MSIKTQLYNVTYIWDGSQLIADDGDIYTEVGFPIAETLQLLDKETTTLETYQDRIRIGDEYSTYEFDPILHTWMMLTA